MSTYTGSAFATKYAAYLIYKGSATAAALNISQPKIGYVYDITEGGTLTPGNITVQHGDAVVYLAQGWTHCNNGGADQAIADLSSQLDELIEEIGETDFSKFALKTELPTVPTKVSAFNNDAGYLTQHQSLANYALKTEIPDVSNFAPYSAIPQNVSQLTNDAHYLTEAVLNNRVRKVNDLAQDTDATDGEIVQLTTDGRFYRFTEPQAEGESGTWTTINQPADIASNDQILAQNNSGNLTATLGMSYNSTNQHLELKGIGDAVIAYVDMTAFLKDGMLDDVTYYTTAEPGITTPTPYIKFTFNTDSGKSVLRISLSDLLNIYDGANINLTSAFVKAATYSAPAIGDSMDVAIGKLLKGHEDNAAAIATKQDTLTFDDAPQSGSNRPVTSQGIKAAIDAVAQTAAQGLECVDLTVYQGGTDGKIVKHTGATTAKYVNGWNYKLSDGGTIPAHTLYIKQMVGGERFDTTSTEIAAHIAQYKFPFVYKGKKVLYETYANGFQVYFPEGFPQVGDPCVMPTGAINYVTAVTAEEVVVDDWLHFSTEFPESAYYENADGVQIYTTFNSEFAFSGDLVSRQTYFELGTTWCCYNVDFTFSKNDEAVSLKEWKQHDSQPSSVADVSALQQRMTAAETAIGGKQATITGAASTITTANLTASKVLGSDANGKLAATSIATADAEDAVSKRHTQNTDTKIVSGNNKVEVSASGTAITGNGSVSGNFSISGNLNVTGKETVEEIVNIKSENNFITLRDGAQTAIASGSLSGTKVENYDGLGNDLLFGTDASGTFRIGDEGGTLEPILTRAEAANLADGELLMWDATNQRAVKANMSAEKIVVTDSNGNVRTTISISTQELGTLDGISSNIQTQLNAKAPSANTVNGAPLSNAASYFYGVSTSAANATQKEVSIPSITTLNAGQMIVVQPTVTTDTIDNATLKLNDFAAYPIKYATLIQVSNTSWDANVPSAFIFDGQYWVFLCRGYDTEYRKMPVAEGIAGTATTNRVIRADYLQQIIHGQIDKFVGTRAMTEDAYWDLVAAGTVQQNTLYITFDNDWEG